MKRLFCIICCILLLSGCAAGKAEQNVTASSGDYPAAIMAEGELWYLTEGDVPGEVADEAIEGETVYTDAMPEKDGEANFSRDPVPYAKVEEGIAVLVDNEWRLCLTKEG